MELNSKRAGNQPALSHLHLHAVLLHHTQLHLNRAAHQHFFDFADGFGWVQLFRAHVHAVHNGMTAEQTVWVVQVVQAR